jgi:hypothetical protein
VAGGEHEVVTDRAGHQGCSRGWTGGTRVGSHGRTPAWRRARLEWESAAAISSRLRLLVVWEADGIGQNRPFSPSSP